jgi:putative salt-induced outer membrane protein
MTSRRLFLLLSALFISAAAHADEVHLTNGDRYSGEIVSVTPDQITLRTDAAGQISLARKFVSRVEPASRLEEKAAAPAPAPSAWRGEASLGYAQTTGNTETSQADGRVAAARKQGPNEIQLKADASYSSRDKEMNSRKYYGMGRFAQDFGGARWYRFVKLEADHDRFANIGARFIPSLGVGYRLVDEADAKLYLEAGAGAEYTDYRDETDDSVEMVVVPRLYAEKKIGGMTLSEDLTVYPSLTEAGEYRLRSDTSILVPFAERLSGRLSLIDDYNSNAPAGTEKNYLRAVSSLVYSF